MCHFKLSLQSKFRAVLWFLFGGLVSVGVAGIAAAPLTTVEYRITGSSLAVSPAVLSVPKGIAGSISAALSGDPSLRVGTVVEATLRGPGLPPRQLLAAPGEPLLLPPLPIVGDYQLDNIRLVDGLTGAVRLEATPSSVPVHVFDEVLVSRVTSRPLTAAEIEEKGIFIDEKNFRVTEFEVGFVLDGKTIPFRLPVVAPRASQSTEIIPAAELEVRLRQAEQLNSELSLSAVLPPEIAVTGIEVRGIDFQFTEDFEEELGLRIPPIPALLVIPGNIGFLNQFFSVQVFTENAAPGTSGLSVRNIRAELLLPAGTDRIAGTFDRPGDDPLRFARVGPDKLVQPVQPVVRAGPDGKIGTADDIARLLPGETGQGEFLVEGLSEGLHVMELKLTAELEGLAAGVVKINGRAAGSVLVRNPKFSIVFTHPRTIRSGEPYDASVTILNTGLAPANFVSVTLPGAAVSGAILETPASVELGTILPGQSATARYRLRAQRTGRITFSNLTFGENATAGRFNLTMGVDERGVELSPDSLAMPPETDALPKRLLIAAERVLGQALSSATAPVLPNGVRKTSRDLIRTRVLELAEAGQRLRYGDTLARVLPDLLLDWQGGRRFDTGFDQLLRETDAGAEWRTAVALEASVASTDDAVVRLQKRAADLAGRSERWTIVADTFGPTNVTRSLELAGGRVTPERSAVPGGLMYRGPGGTWWVAREPVAGRLEWRALTEVAGSVSRLELATNGTGKTASWVVPSIAATGCFQLNLPAAGDAAFAVDPDCDGTPNTTLVALNGDVQELPPAVIGVVQDLSVLAGRPERPCIGPKDVFNYGTVLGVLFSKPLGQATAGRAEGYRLDNGVVAQSVQVQPGGRLALVNLRQGVSAIRERTLTVTGVTDSRGALVSSAAVTNRSIYKDAVFREGVAIQGRVIRADGSVAAGVPVTLLMKDQAIGGFDCVPYDFRVSQVLTDPTGAFTFDLVLAGVPYVIGATDTSTLSAEALAALLAAGGTSEDLRRQLLDLGSQTPGSLLEALAVGALPQAIAKAEGLDRAILQDVVELGSERKGGTNFVALRFRGRGTVSGTVFAADGTTPVPNVAVNLFPDPGSRELGRGVFSDATGRFAFFGVPLGTFTLNADTGGRLTRRVAGALATPGEVQDLAVVLSAGERGRGSLMGRVTEADLVTPHAGASVFVGKFRNGVFVDVVAAVRSDSGGLWTALDIPVDTYDVVGISLDGQRRGEALRVPVNAGETNRVAVALQGFGLVVGRVTTVAGVPVENALVAGGLGTTRTGPDGRFRLADVPTGRRTVSTAVEATRPGEAPKSTPSFAFQRRGSVALEVLPGVLNVADIVLEPAGVVRGTVRDAAGRPVSGIRVARPVDGGFLHVPVDANGVYAFEGLGLGSHTVSAPAPPVENTDVSEVLATLSDSGSSADAIQAAIADAFALFTGAKNPLLNGEGAAFNPDAYGFSNTEIRADGEVVSLDIQFLRLGTVGGIVKNGQDVPVGAKVRLTGLGAAPNGAPVLRIRSADLNSDAASGLFEFRERILFGRAGGMVLPGQVTPGTFGVQAATPFSPVVISTGGLLTIGVPQQTNLVLQFPAPREIQGRIAGRVLNPDGSPAAAGVRILIPFEGGLSPRDAKAGFRPEDIRNPITQEVGSEIIPGLSAVPPEFPPTASLNAISDGRPGVSYPVVAHDRLNGLLGVARVVVFPGQTNDVTVRLLGQGAVRVRVVAADGTPVRGAELMVEAGTFPFGQATGVTDAAGEATLGGLFENFYSVTAGIVQGPSRITGRNGVTVARGGLAEVTVTLQPTATVTGRFLANDQSTPIANAQVSVGSLGFAATAADGTFAVPSLPLGNYRLTGVNPVNGSVAFLDLRLATNNEVRVVTLIEPARGEITGTVVNSFGTAGVPGAEVSLNLDDGVNPARTTTTDPAGVFRFPGTPAGSFTLRARDPLTDVEGSVAGTLASGVARLEIDVRLAPRANVLARVLTSNGAPATNASVVLTSGTQIQRLVTDPTGRVRFEFVPLGPQTLFARFTGRVGSRSVAQVVTNVTAAGDSTEFELILSGTGSLTGRVFLSDGTTPVPAGTVVSMEPTSALLAGDAENTVTDATGRYRFDNVAVGANRLSVRAVGLSATATAEVPANVEVTQDLFLTPSGSVLGRIVRANDQPAAQVSVVLFFGNRGGTTDRAAFTTAADGEFRLDDIPVGSNYRLEAAALRFDGVARTAVSLQANGDVVNVGDLKLDEAPPRVVASAPAPGATGVGAAPILEITFSEALDPASLTADGILLRQGTNVIPLNLSLIAPPGETNRRVVRAQPTVRLRSQTIYTVLLIDELPSATGGSTFGVRDTVGRLLAAPATFSFTTADNDPPVLVSVSPAEGQSKVEAVEPVRFAFNEALRPGAVITVTGPEGLIAGKVELVFGDQAFSFLSTLGLPPNATLTASISNVFDLAGNAALNQPLTVRFQTLDTRGPDLASLRVVGNRPPVAALTVTLEAEGPELGVGDQVRFSRDGVTLGVAEFPPFRLPLTLPGAGSVRILATASDRFGNLGNTAELTLNVVPNRAPLVSLSRVEPATGAVGSGLPLRFDVAATDDLAVTNVAVRLALNGATFFNTNFPSAGTHTVSLTAPSGLVAPGTIRISALAQDELGLASAEAGLEIAIEPRSGPVISGPPPFELIVNQSTNLPVLASSSDGGLAELAVTNVFNLTSVTFPPGTNRLIFQPSILTTNVAITIRAGAVSGTNFFTLTALGTNGLRAALIVPVVTLGDLDGDGIADRDDPDVDGDGLTNADEITRGTDPRNRDTDGDTFTDGTEIIAGTNPRLADTDGDGIRDNLDQFPLVPNRPPVAANDSLKTRRDGFVEFQKAALLANDSDPENEGLVFIGIEAPARGTVTEVTTELLRYTPPTGFSGTDTFRYTVRDLHGLTVTATVTVTISANRPPAALAGTATTGQGVTALLAPEGSDPDGDLLTFTVRSLPTNGQLFQVTGRFNPGRGDALTNVPIVVTGFENRLFFQPNPGFFGTNGFTFTVNDGEFDSPPATFQITVTENPLADTDGDGLLDRYERSNGLNPLVNDTADDLDGDTLTNLREFQIGTAPNRADTDNDGLRDGAELTAGTNPLNSDTDGDGILDGNDPNPLAANADQDGDGIEDGLDDDVDGDGLLNTAEINIHGTNPGKRDTDGDGWPDGVEVEAGTDPLLATSFPPFVVFGEPTVALVLPAAPSADLLTGNVTVGEPVVELLLPSSPSGVDLNDNITVSEPVVNLLLPAAPSGLLLSGNVIVSEPIVSLLLPAAPTLDGFGFGGMVISDPPVELLLPAAPTGDLVGNEIVVAEPAVFIGFLKEDGRQPAGGLLEAAASGVGSRAVDRPVRLLRVELQPQAGGARPAGLETASSVGAVVLDWSGPDSGRYLVEVSNDLQTWTTVPAESLPAPPSTFRARCLPESAAASFYRVRRQP